MSAKTCRISEAQSKLAEIELKFGSRYSLYCEAFSSGSYEGNGIMKLGSVGRLLNSVGGPGVLVSQLSDTKYYLAFWNGSILNYPVCILFEIIEELFLLVLLIRSSVNKLIYVLCQHNKHPFHKQQKKQYMTLLACGPRDVKQKP